MFMHGIKNPEFFESLDALRRFGTVSLRSLTSITELTFVETLEAYSSLMGTGL